MTVYEFLKTRNDICRDALDCYHCPLKDVCTPIAIADFPLNEKKVKALISRVSKIIANEKRRTKTEE